MTTHSLFQKDTLVHTPASSETKTDEKNKPDNTSPHHFGTTIFAYTRKAALEDGVLVDVSELARQAGFRYPVAMTHDAYDKFVDWTPDDTKRQCLQNVKGRLWDVLYMLYIQIKRMPDEGGLFKLTCIPRSPKSRRRTPVNVLLKAIIGGGDEGEPVITIMLPNED